MNLKWIKDLTPPPTDDDTRELFILPRLPAVEVVMFHQVSHKRQTEVRHSTKYRIMLTQGWVELK